MRWINIIAGMILWFLSLSAWADPAVVGKWLTIDDQTQQPRSIVQINEENGQVQGKLIKIYFRAGEKDADTCTKCTDEAHKNQRILGMTILWGMVQTAANQWTQGQILDPKNGKIYHCILTLSPNGQELKVRGYIGIPLLGRTQTWMRAV